MKIMVIQGPNLNMLGTREPRIYGTTTLEEVHNQMKLVANEAKMEIEFFQSNFEGEIVDKIQECYGTSDGIIINPGAFTHTSIAIRDAIAGVGLPVVEVHISNLYRREEFRKENYIAPVCVGSISGFGVGGYHLAMISMIQIFQQIKNLQAQQNQ